MPIYKTGKSKDGKQKYRVQINYTDANGNYRTKSQTVYGSTEAKTAEQRMTAELTELKVTSSMTVRQLYDEYTEAKKSDVRLTSLNKSKTILNNHVLPYVADVRIDKLDKRELQKWKTTIAALDLSITMKRNIYGEFNAMLNYAVRMDHLPQNQLAKLGNFKDVYFEKPQDKLHYYTIEQFTQYIAAAKSHTETLTDRGFYVFFCIAFFTGMRKGEINALKWNDIEGNIIHVRRSVAQKVKGNSIVETPPKNQSSYRDIQMPQMLVNILNEHKAAQQEDKRWSEDYRVCGAIACLSDTAISNRNAMYAKEAGLPRIRIHDFRHSHASLLANEGINIQEIARRLGHAKIEMTWNTYSHLYPREEERALKVLDTINIA